MVVQIDFFPAKWLFLLCFKFSLKKLFFWVSLILVPWEVFLKKNQKNTRQAPSMRNPIICFKISVIAYSTALLRPTSICQKSSIECSSDAGYLKLTGRFYCCKCQKKEKAMPSPSNLNQINHIGFCRVLVGIFAHYSHRIPIIYAKGITHSQSLALTQDPVQLSSKLFQKMLYKIPYFSFDNRQSSHFRKK